MLTGFRLNESRSATLKPQSAWQQNNYIETTNQFAPWDNDEPFDCLPSHYLSTIGYKSISQTSKAKAPPLLSFVPDIETYTQNLPKYKDATIDLTQGELLNDSKETEAKVLGSDRRRKNIRQKIAKESIRLVPYGQSSLIRGTNISDANNLYNEKGSKLNRKSHKISRSVKHSALEGSLLGNDVQGQSAFMNNASIERGNDENSVRFNKHIHSIFCNGEDSTDQNLTLTRSKESLMHLESVEMRSDMETLQFSSREITTRSKDRSATFIRESNESPKDKINKFGSLYRKILDDSPYGGTRTTRT